jgi:chorismate mutase
MDALESKRKMLDDITLMLVDLISLREEVAREVGLIKKSKDIPITNLKREAEVLKKAKAYAKKRGVNPLLAERIMRLLIEDAKRFQR